MPGLARDHPPIVTVLPTQGLSLRQPSVKGMWRGMFTAPLQVPVLWPETQSP